MQQLLAPDKFAAVADISDETQGDVHGALGSVTPALVLPQELISFTPTLLGAIFGLCRRFKKDGTAFNGIRGSPLSIEGLLVIARAIADHDAHFIYCVDNQLGQSGGYDDLAQQMQLLEQALLDLTCEPQSWEKDTHRPKASKAYKRRITSLRADFGNVLDSQVLLALANEPASVVTALVTLKVTV